MEKIRTIIVDDEPLALKRLKELLLSDNEIDVIDSCKNGEEAIVAITDLQPDLVFLDIQMPEITGFDVLENIDLQHPPVIVFVTAYDQYALQAFEVHAIDYLLKPFDKKRFNKALERAKKYVKQVSETDFKNNIEQLVAYHRTEGTYIPRLMVKKGERFVFLKIDEIDWIEAAGNYIQITVGDKSYMLRETMSNMEEKLNPESFARVHRSTIVNIERIKTLEPWFHGDYKIKLKTGKELTMSRNYKELLKQF